MSAARRPPYGPPWPRGGRRRPGSGPWRAKGRRPFGDTWWARAWVEALEGRARLDPNRLPRGRTYARTGAVSGLVARAGEIRAEVQGSRARPYAVVVAVRTFARAEWDRVLDSLAAEAGRAAALFEGDLPPALGEELRAAGVDLLPQAGDLTPRCSCPDRAVPCKHAAATCYLVADLLDDDPFALFLLRGRHRDELLSALRERRAAPGACRATDRGARSGANEPGTGEGWERAAEVPARDVWAGAAALGPLPPLPLLPRRPGRPAPLAADPPAGSGVTAGQLHDLASDAARRAFDLARGVTASSGLELSYREDVARRLAALVDEGTGAAELDAAAGRVGLSRRELERWALAWRNGGSGGLSALLDPFDPPAGRLTPGEGLLPGKGPARTWRNRLTRGEHQLRLGRDGLWYPYRRSGRAGWEPSGPPVAASERSRASRPGSRP